MTGGLVRCSVVDMSWKEHLNPNEAAYVAALEAELADRAAWANQSRRDINVIRVRAIKRAQRSKAALAKQRKEA